MSCVVFMSILLMLCDIGRGKLIWDFNPTITIDSSHMFQHLREPYQLSLLGTLWRTVVLLLVALFSLSIFALSAL